MSDMEELHPMIPPNVEEGGRDGRAGEEEDGIKLMLEKARKGFFRKVYGMLACELCVTVLVSAWMMLTPAIRHDVYNHTLAVYLIALFPLLGLMFALFMLRQQYPLNVALLFFFVLSFSFLIGTICAQYYEDGYGYAILVGFGITIVLFALLTVMAWQNCCELTMSVELLVTASFVLVLSVFLHILFGGWHLSLFVACLACLVLCLLIIVDVHRLFDDVGVDEYILANVNLYIEVLNLFTWVAEILRFAR